MKKFTARVLWIALFISMSLFTSAANTADRDPGYRSKETLPVPLSLSGGPDAFGYTYQDEADPGVYHPNFDPTDISSTGTGLNIAGEDGAANIPPADLAGFDFSFYGTPVTSLRIGNNGAILVNAGLADKISFSNACLNSPSAPDNIIAPWWDDWDRTAASSINWQRDGSGSNEHLMIEWRNMQHYQAAAYPDPVTFKVILYERGSLIEFHYDDATSDAGITRGASGTIGIRAAPTHSLEYGCDTESLVDQRAIRFQHNAITIIKDASPQSAHGFDFTTTIPGHTSFPLYDDSDPLTPNQEITHPLPGVYTVSEAAAANWSLSSLTCATDLPPGNITATVSTRTAVIDTRPGEHVTCTFLNVNTGSVVIQKVAAPAGASQAFPFTGSLPGYEAFMLDDNSDGTYSNTLTVTGLTPGSYTVIEGAVDGWALSDLTCADPDSGTTTDGSTASIDLDADETITCIFTNSAMAEPASYLPLVINDRGAD
jgi:hypothetical protein